MNNYKELVENNFTINHTFGEALQSSVSSMVSVLADYQRQMQEISFGYLQDTLSDFAQQMTQICLSSADFGVISETLRQIVETNIFPLVDHEIISPALLDSVKALGNSFYDKDAIQALSTSYSELLSNYEDMFSEISSISENEFEVLLDGTEYTRDEVLADIKLFKEEISNKEPFDNSAEDDKIYLQRKVDVFLKNHPAIAHVLYCIYLAITIASGVQVTQDMLLPLAQNAIVSLQGCEDIFFVKVDSAKLYTAPDSHSDVITKILYAEQVTQIDSVKQWDKVIYINPEGEEITGWIAKRNLMTYQEYEFNSDDLYSIE